MIMKLTRDKSGRYLIKNKKRFNGSPVRFAHKEKSSEFALKMVLNSSHRVFRSGGASKRDEQEVLINTFQGKLAEYVVQDILTSFNLECSEPDNVDYGNNVWDDRDLLVGGSAISIKSMSYFSNLLLLETKDYDEFGNYRHHHGSDYEYIIIVRFRPDIKMTLGNNNNGIKDIAKTLVALDLEFDIPAVCSRKTVAYIIQHGYVLPQGSTIGKSTRLDANNFYIQLGSLPPLQKLITAIDNKS